MINDYDRCGWIDSYRNKQRSKQFHLSQQKGFNKLQNHRVVRKDLIDPY